MSTAQNKPRGIAQRIEALERAVGTSDDDDIRAFMDSVEDCELGRYIAYLKALAAASPATAGTPEPPSVSDQDYDGMSDVDRWRHMKPGLEAMRERERPLIEALRDARKPLTRDKALRIAAKVMPANGLPLEGFSTWLDSYEGFNYLRELNGEAPMHLYEWQQRKDALERK